MGNLVIGSTILQGAVAPGDACPEKVMARSDSEGKDAASGGSGHWEYGDSDSGSVHVET